jgi:hypothetical protein
MINGRKWYATITQRTDEWLQLRLGKLSGSRYGKLHSKSGKLLKSAETLALTLLAEKLTGEPEMINQSFAMQQGIELEPDARDMYEQFTQQKVEEIGGVMAFCEDVRPLWYSPDGVIGESGLLEIKCPQPKEYLRILINDNAIEDYMPQLQFGLFVSGLQWIDFIAYNPDFDIPFKIKRVYPDIEYFGKMKNIIREFNKLLDAMEYKLLKIK